MKKITSLLLLTMLVFVFNNCAKETKFTENINYVSFSVNPPTIQVEKDGSTDTDMHVYTTQITGSERTFGIEVVPGTTTISSQAYSVPTSVVVPANSNAGSFTVHANDGNLPEAPVKLALKLVPSDDAFTGSNATLTILKHCTFDAALTIGSYHAVSSGWGVDGNVTITADPNNPLKVYVTGLETIDGVNENRGPLPLIISATNAVTVPKTILATSAFGYTNLAYAGTGSYNSCNGNFTLSMTVSVDQGNFGTYSWTLTRN